MNDKNPSGLDGVAALGVRAGADMRPTLLRVATDLYVQKLTHTAEEERHYSELALRLLDAVDAPTRKLVASRLSRHLSPPIAVLRRLVGDLPEIAEVAAPSRPQLPPRAVDNALRRCRRRPSGPRRNRSLRPPTRDNRSIRPLPRISMRCSLPPTPMSGD